VDLNDLLDKKSLLEREIADSVGALYEEFRKNTGIPPESISIDIGGSCDIERAGRLEVIGCDVYLGI
jgi:hypothetical protein